MQRIGKSGPNGYPWVGLGRRKTLPTRAGISYGYYDRWFVVLAKVGLGMQAVLRHDAVEASEMPSRRQTRALFRLLLSPATVYSGSFPHAMGNFGQAAEHFEHSLSFCR